MGIVFLFFLPLAVAAILGQKYPGARGALWLAVGVRLSLLAVHYLVFRLIPGRGDAIKFINESGYYAELGFLGALFEFDLTHSSGFSAFMGSMMAIFGSHGLVIELLNISMGVAVVGLTYVLARNCGADERNARFGAMVMALAPSIAQYSVVALREMACVFPFMLGLVALTSQRSHQTVVGMAWFVLASLVAAAFHGAMILGIAGLALGMFLLQPFAGLEARRRRQGHGRALVVIVAFVVALSFTADFTADSGLNKVSGVFGGDLISEINSATSSAARGGSGYLHGYSVEGFDDVALTAPLRVVYFFFSPLPWQISSPIHLLGLLDVIIYVWCFWMLWRAFKAKVLQRKTLVVVGVVLTLALAYAFGTSNSGTAVRHRAKFGYALIAAACAARAAEQRQQVRLAADRAARRRSISVGRVADRPPVGR
ncbi:hypothetical protein KHP57_04985 [Algiphilus sp. NNCM1]|uniref:hypothetical protein n=1 Tax=Algiphilus sp. TaxID=1872431 RepID=UPI001CA6BBF5|nr:hypothetical protein [Algiphilus sp.]MBY8965051.1 hypothetical protein [Algiphilus acroporae]MCI5104204.1 hypothetical protein [Algiphilus sp.]